MRVVNPTRKSNALAMAELREVPASRAAGVRRRRHQLGPRRVERCAAAAGALHACDHKGATIQHPGWGGADVGFLPFPVERRSLF